VRSRMAQPLDVGHLRALFEGFAIVSHSASNLVRVESGARKFAHPAWRPLPFLLK
jgi:hypothetical protein